MPNIWGLFSIGDIPATRPRAEKGHQELCNSFSRLCRPLRAKFVSEDCLGSLRHDGGRSRWSNQRRSTASSHRNARETVLVSWLTLGHVHFMMDSVGLHAGSRGGRTVPEFRAWRFFTFARCAIFTDYGFVQNLGILITFFIISDRT